MSQTHIHLMITHLPIYGAILGALVLAYGLWSGSAQTKIAAYGIFIISAIGAGIAYLTGEGAEETVEHMQGVTREMIREHEHFALYALISIVIVGLTSVYGLFITLRKPQQTKNVAILILLISLVSWGLVARTGYLGGQIRHSEVRSTSGATNSETNKTND